MTWSWLHTYAGVRVKLWSLASLGGYTSDNELYHEAIKQAQRTIYYKQSLPGDENHLPIEYPVLAIVKLRLHWLDDDVTSMHGLNLKLFLTI